MKRQYILVLICCLLTCPVISQSRTDSFLKPSDTLDVLRRNTVVISEASLASLTLIGACGFTR